jgi:hypothetical protein
MKRSSISIVLLGTIFLSAIVVGAVVAKASSDRSSSSLINSDTPIHLTSSTAVSCIPTDLRNSHDILQPPNYLTFTPPALGGTYCDTTFGTEVRRLTNTGMGHTTNSELSYFNIDDSYFIAIDDNVTYLFDGEDGHKIKELGVGGIRPWWMRWPRSNTYTLNGQKFTFDPTQHFYKYEGNEIRLYSVDTLEYIVLHKFSEYSAIGPAGGEGDISQDGRYWILDGQKPDGDLVLFAYDLLDDLKGPEVPFEVGDVGGKGEGVDYAVISPSGKYIVIAWDAGREDPYTDDKGFQHYGVEVFDRATWEFQRVVHPIRIHFDLGFDSQGREALFATAGNNPGDLATFNVPDLALGDMVMVRLDDGVGTKLLDVPRWVHQTSAFAAGRNQYIFIAFEVKSEDPTQDWSQYWGEIVAVATDGSGDVVRLLHHRSRKVGDQIQKAFQPDFFPNNAGDKIVMQSTYGVGGPDLYIFDFERGDEDEDPIFIDVPLDHPYYNEIEILYQNGYTAGCNADPLMYCPEHILNRAESAVFVDRGNHGAEFDPPDPTEIVFEDVALTDWYADWVHTLWNDGFTSGCGTDPLIYCPDQEHTRAEGCVFYLRMMYGADYEPPAAKGYFKDVEAGVWYERWVDAAWEAGIIEPCAVEPDMLFCPEDGLTRAVAAYMMVQAKDLNP